MCNQGRGSWMARRARMAPNRVAVRRRDTGQRASVPHRGAGHDLPSPTLLKGGTAVLMPSFDVERAFDLIEAERVTVMFDVPAMFNALAQSLRWDGADLSSVRILMCGGAPVPESTIPTYQRRGPAGSARETSPSSTARATSGGASRRPARLSRGAARPLQDPEVRGVGGVTAAQRLGQGARAAAAATLWMIPSV